MNRPPGSFCVAEIESRSSSDPGPIDNCFDRFGAPLEIELYFYRDDQMMI